MAIFLSVMDEDVSYMRRMADWVKVHPESGFQMRPVANPDDVSSQLACPQDIVLMSASVLQKWPHASERSGNSLPARFIVLDDGRTGSNADTSSDSGSTGSDGGMLPDGGRTGSVGGMLPDGGGVALISGSLQGKAGVFPRTMPCVRKYQPLLQLLEEVRQVAEIRGWVRMREGHGAACMLTVVLHLCGATYMQPVAPLLSAFGAKHAEWLLLNLDPALDGRCWFPEGDGAGLSRLAFEVKQPDTFNGKQLDNCFRLDGATRVRFCPVPSLPQDAATFDAASVAVVRNTLGKTGVNMMLVDGGVGLARRNLELARMADRLILVTTSDLYGRACMEAVLRLQEQLQTTGEEIWHGDSEVFWVVGGEASGVKWPSLPAPHHVLRLPSAFPDGFQEDAWAVSDAFLRGMHSLGAGIVRRPA